MAVINVRVKFDKREFINSMTALLESEYARSYEDFCQSIDESIRKSIYWGMMPFPVKPRY